ncbi:kinase-like domain-containing protein, partial [Lactarius sanguifluus]
SLGSIYLGRDIKTGTKISPKIGHADYSSLRLNHEYNMYMTLAGSAGISQVHWYGKEGSHEVIVLEHLGTSLGDLISEQQVDHCKAFLYASQMLSSVKSLYAQHYIHHDIKLGNFMVQVDKDLHPTVFLIDLGLAQLFCNPTTYLHAPYSTNHLIVGTLLFMSINGQQGHAQSHHDDLESLAYTIIYSACGDLPWMDASARGNWGVVLWKKSSVMAEELCKGLPTPFCKFINHVHLLDFDEKPNYQLLHSILLCCLATETPAPPFPTISPISVDRTPTLNGQV